MLTGIKDLDLKILNLLDDKSLANTFKLNRYFRTLSRIESFWLNRSLQRWGKYLGDLKTIDKYRERAFCHTWRTYYFSILKYIKKINNYPCINHNYNFRTGETNYYLSFEFGDMRNAEKIKRRDIVILMEKRLIRDKLHKNVL